MCDLIFFLFLRKVSKFFRLILIYTVILHFPLFRVIYTLILFFCTLHGNVMKSPLIFAVLLVVCVWFVFFWFFFCINGTVASKHRGKCVKREEPSQTRYL